MHEILQVLRQEHGNIASLLDALEWQVREFDRGNAPDYDVIIAALEYFLGFPDAYHHPKEDLVFAKLRERDPAVLASIGDLSREHEELGTRAREFAAGLRAVLGEKGPPRKTFIQRAHRFIALQRQHLSREEASFFPAAERILTTEDWEDVKARMATGEDPLFGTNVAVRFDRLRRMILTWQAEDKAGDVGIEPRLSFNE